MAAASMGSNVRQPFALAEQEGMNKNDPISHETPEVIEAFAAAQDIMLVGDFLRDALAASAGASNGLRQWNLLVANEDGVKLGALLRPCQNSAAAFC